MEDSEKTLELLKLLARRGYVSIRWLMEGPLRVWCVGIGGDEVSDVDFGEAVKKALRL